MPRTTAQFEEIRSTRTEQILDAARQVFAAQGFHPTRMSDIAQAAGVSQGTLYHYFGSKDELFLAVLKVWHERVADVIQQLPHSDVSAADKFWLVNQIAVSFFETGEDLRPVLVEYWAYTLRHPEAAAAFREFFVVMQHSFKDILGQGMAGGEFKPVDVEILSALPLVILDGIILLSAVVGQDVIKTVELLQQSQRVIFEGLLAGREKPA